MNISEIDFPEKFRSIIRRLQAAVQEKEVRDLKKTASYHQNILGLS
ncbi:MAG: hypothetical protein R2795_26910 [Saprospiraceae bacterium]